MVYWRNGKIRSWNDFFEPDEANTIIILLQKTEKDSRSATESWICEGLLCIPNDRSQLGCHCHLTGKYRGAAHPNFILNVEQDKLITVIFHNLSNYHVKNFN